MEVANAAKCCGASDMRNRVCRGRTHGSKKKKTSGDGTREHGHGEWTALHIVERKATYVVGCRYHNDRGRATLRADAIAPGALRVSPSGERKGDDPRIVKLLLGWPAAVTVTFKNQGNRTNEVRTIISPISAFCSREYFSSKFANGGKKKTRLVSFNRRLLGQTGVICLRET